MRPSYVIRLTSAIGMAAAYYVAPGDGTAFEDGRGLDCHLMFCEIGENNTSTALPYELF